MDKLPYYLTLCCLFGILTACRPVDKSDDAVRLARKVVAEVREHVLPFWTTYAPAPDGGFYGTLLRNGTPVSDDPRGGVLNARILWSFAAAGRTWHDSLCLQLADRAQRYFLQTFVDRRHGGVYWLVAPDGQVVNASKYTYAVTYGIYGLAEHYLATGNRESLEAAFNLYRTLEEKGRDPQYDGYFEAFTQDWKLLDTYDKDAPKTMNAHLHVLEAYNLLYRCRPDKHLRQRLDFCIRLFLDRIYDPARHHFNLYFDKAWNSLLDMDSYGHDAEAGWLLCEAASTLGDESLLARARQVALDVTRTCLDEGLTSEGDMRYERTGSRKSSRSSWWGQDETLIACINAWQISRDERFVQVADSVWQFVVTRLKDYDYGEWYSDCQDGRPLIYAPKASLWRCPYHTTRLAVELYNRLLTQQETNHEKN